MKRISVDEFRRNAGKYLKDVQAGDTVHVLDQGALVAVLAPPSREQAAYERLVAEGKIIPPSARWWVPDPIIPKPGRPTLMEALEEQRGERYPDLP